MAELKGSLGSLGLPAIVQLIGELHHSGNLALTRNGSRGLLGFADGRLVTASYNDDSRGLTALAACTLELVDGEFVFVEGAPAGERTLDLGGSELQKLFDRIAAGEVAADSLGLLPPHTDDPTAAENCPLLGFVDDASRHYSRPTALHRCYASGAPALVSGQEQRDLCLSGRFTTCPRFRGASTQNSVNTAPAPAPVAPVPVSTPGAVRSPRGIPAGVAARLEAASQMQVADASPAAAGAASTGLRAYEPDMSETLPPGGGRFRFRSQRGLSLLAIGGLVGLVVVVAGVFLVFASLRGGFGQKPAPVAAQSEPAAAPAPTLTRATTTASGSVSKPVTTVTATSLAGTVPGALPAQSSPSTLPTAASTVPPVVATAVPTVPPTPTTSVVAAPLPGQMLADARFASGPKQGWLENPPYAMWSDGAYRLKAAQVTRFVAVGAPILAPLSDVVVSATFRKTGGPPGGGYGLVVRNQSPESLNGVNQDARAYVFEAGDRGEFGVWRRDGDHWVDLAPWARTDSVRPGGSPNDLEVRAVGDQLTFSVNGVELAAVQDATLASGGVGVFVGGDYNEVALDRFVAQVPD